MLADVDVGQQAIHHGKVRFQRAALLGAFLRVGDAVLEEERPAKLVVAEPRVGIELEGVAGDFFALCKLALIPSQRFGYATAFPSGANRATKRNGYADNI